MDFVKLLKMFGSIGSLAKKTLGTLTVADVQTLTSHFDHDISDDLAAGLLMWLNNDPTNLEQTVVTYLSKPDNLANLQTLMISTAKTLHRCAACHAPTMMDSNAIFQCAHCGSFEELV